MTVKVGINGFGRIGRLAFRRLLAVSQASTNIEVVAINDLTSPSMLAYLLKYDTTHGPLEASVTATDDALIVDGHTYHVYAEPDAAKIPWAANDGVDFVLECTGFYTSKEKAAAHLRSGVKRVLVSAPAGRDVKTIVPSVNEQQLTAADQIVSAGSCTTNCLAPMADALDREFGIVAGTMTTVHAFTSSQMILDGPSRGGKLRPARTASANTIPHSSGAAKAIGLVLPQLDGKLQGHAQCVPVIDGSLTELVTVLKTGHLTADEINARIKPYTDHNESFGWNEDQIVSSDIINSTFGSVFDPTQTEVITAGDTQLVKSVAWYDNEYGFTCQMIRVMAKMASL